MDNTVATYSTPLIYKRIDNTPTFETISLAQPLELVVGITGKESLTADAVARVRHAWQQYPERYEGVFDQIQGVTEAGHEALRTGNLAEIGELMNLCHGYLNALQLSTPELEELIHIARTNGAIGAKLTGGGVGGSMIALCPDNKQAVQNAMQAAGYQTIEVTID